MKNLLPSFINSFLLSSSLSYGGFLVDRIFDKRFSWVEKPLVRLLATLATYTLYSFVASFIVITAYVWVRNPQLSFKELNLPYFASEAVSPMIIAVTVNAIFTTRSWLFEWRKSVLEAEQLKRAVLAGQNQSLKDQLNPHFLFNSLNTLSSLVYESAERSDKFIQSLSKIYRYVLEVQQEELVSLEKELGFAKNYLELQKIRFEDKMIFEISISSTAGKNLPPLSLQLLLENAVKHTVATTKNPLKIKITEEDEFLVVRNNWQPKKEKLDGVGIGLENIKKRYQLLSDKAPIISQDENFFTVKLPLLNISE
ncbi:sensor histidine kinase [Marivirga arenosa]|uniref:Sensor histidine kinase n=1 Tax=Marivirga arenosa TaxID=3059076 RepID=A0AA51R7W3_9BACT|nr:sensor histidine kinase [Marivirga sp. ABR2-2]WMN05991.1 sensor histidine kinase [Marivirga sp. ABR2-2]